MSGRSCYLDLTPNSHNQFMKKCVAAEGEKTIKITIVITIIIVIIIINCVVRCINEYVRV